MGLEVDFPMQLPAATMVQYLDNTINEQLRNLAIEFQRRMATYPPWQPWTSKPPKTGPRAGGRRTGNYGRGWSSTNIRAGRGYIEVFNDIEYGPYVGGPNGPDGTQTAVMAARGWPSVSDMAVEVLQEMINDGRLDFMPPQMK